MKLLGLVKSAIGFLPLSEIIVLLVGLLTAYSLIRHATADVIAFLERHKYSFVPLVIIAAITVLYNTAPASRDTTAGESMILMLFVFWTHGHTQQEANAAADDAREEVEILNPLTSDIVRQHMSKPYKVEIWYDPAAEEPLSFVQPRERWDNDGRPRAVRRTVFTFQNSDFNHDTEGSAFDTKIVADPVQGHVRIQVVCKRWSYRDTSVFDFRIDEPWKRVIYTVGIVADPRHVNPVGLRPVGLRPVFRLCGLMVTFAAAFILFRGVVLES